MTRNIDDLIRQRASWATGLGMGLLGSLSLSVTGIEADSPGGAVQRGAWLIWLALVVAFLITSGAWWRKLAVRQIMTDETTFRHMQRSYVTGFWVFTMCSALAYGATFVAPLEARETLRIVATAAIAATTLRFGSLERRALQVD